MLATDTTCTSILSACRAIGNSDLTSDSDKSPNCQAILDISCFSSNRGKKILAAAQLFKARAIVDPAEGAFQWTAVGDTLDVRMAGEACFPTPETLRVLDRR
eukprot:428172-Amphidinium_carterae.2